MGHELLGGTDRLGSLQDACAYGIRISIRDEQPHTNGLGTDINAQGYFGWCLPGEGMVLNFTFANWATANCAGANQRQSCIESIAVHEFGHALGFSHEQNRPDTPTTCTEAPQGANGDTMVGAWDLSSVMNYCNPNWNNGGRLSATDIQGVQQFYGPPCTRCGGEVCVNTYSDSNNCGGCGIVCAPPDSPTGICWYGSCWTGVCRPGQLECCGGQYCADTECPICP